MELYDVILRTNRVRCALNMEILDLLNEECYSQSLLDKAWLGMPLSMFGKEWHPFLVEGFAEPDRL